MSAETDREEPVKGKTPREPADEPLVSALVQRISENAWVLIALLVPAAVVVGFIQGPGAAILVLLAAALITVIALFWSSVRTLLGETPLTGADAYAIAAPRAEEEQKQAVLRALKDLEFERSVGKISDEDYAALVARYRAEAKRLLRAIDDDARPRRESVEHLVRKRLVEAGLEPAPEPTTDTSRSPAAVADEKKKKKKRKGDGAAASPEAPAAAPAPEPEDVARRVEIEPVADPEKAAEPKKAGDKPKVGIDITWKSPLPTKTKESAAYVVPTKKCAECGTRNDPDANFCKKCGSKAFEGGAAKGATAKSATDSKVEEAASDNAAEDEAASDNAAEETAR